LVRSSQERVIDTPISEAGFTAWCGCGDDGLRPVVDIMFGDFITYDGTRGESGAKVHYMSAEVESPDGDADDPGRDRAFGGAALAVAACVFSHVPGLKKSPCLRLPTT